MPPGSDSSTMPHELICNVQGLCDGPLGGFYTVPSIEQCMQKCKDDADCSWWSHDGDEFCLLTSRCTYLDTSYTAAISGEKDCAIVTTEHPTTTKIPENPECDMPGQCKGTFAGFDVTGTRDLCLNYCQETPNCQWWTFDPQTNYCTLSSSEDCNFEPSPSHPDTISGKRDCAFTPNEPGP